MGDTRKITVVFGTRPEAIKMAPVVQSLRETGMAVRVVVTAQHREMLDQVLGLFDIRPDDDLNLMQPAQTLPDLFSRVLTGMSSVLERHRTDFVLVHGDTTTTAASALAAFYARIPVGHVEAGLRTGNLQAPWPEEMNRKVTACLSTLHFAPTEQARANLLAEGVHPETIHVTGNTVIDALLMTHERIRRDPILRSRLEAKFPFLSEPRRTILVTGHRRENFGPGLERICAALKALAARGDVQIVYPVHPNPNVSGPVRQLLSGVDGIHLVAPLDYAPFVYLMSKSALILTDSGGIQEEAPSLGKKVLVMRNTTERPEAVAAGNAILVGTDTDSIVREAGRILDTPERETRADGAGNPFGDGHAAKRIARILSGIHPHG